MGSLCGIRCTVGRRECQVKIYGLIARLFRRVGSKLGQRSKASDDLANRPIRPNEGAGGSHSHGSRAINLIRGVSLTLAAIFYSVNCLVVLENVHDRGGICSFDLVRGYEAVSSLLCSSVENDSVKH